MNKPTITAVETPEYCKRPTNTYYMMGPQYVLMRKGKCNCGCKGRDPWHAMSIKRVVRNVVFLEEPETTFRHRAKGNHFHIKTVAYGEVKHPSGMIRVRLDAIFDLDPKAFIPVSLIGWSKSDI